MSGGLYDPLGADRAEAGTDRRPGIAGRISRLSPPAMAGGLMLAGLAGLLFVSWWRDTGDRGSPVAVGTIEHVQAPAMVPAPTVGPAAPPTAAAAAPPLAQPFAPLAGAPPAGPTSARTDQDVEIQNGVRIVRPHRDPPPPRGQAVPVVPGAVR